jgi:hypothetical protein
MKSDQSLHITIKQPANPHPIQTLGILEDLDNPNLPRIVQSFLDGTVFEPKSNDFRENVKEEVLQLLAKEKPIAAAKKGDLTIVYFQKQ